MKKQRAKKDGFWEFAWGLGIAGQLCWNMENQWFNTFVYAKIAKDSSIVTLMVITSALVSTLSTFLFGTLSDRIGSRKRFISIGYIAWGVFTIGFGLTEFLTTGTIGAGVKLGVLAAVMVILMDDIMSFFGSMGNDSGFNAWMNDRTTDKNRGQVGALIAVQPIVGTIVGTVLGGFLIGSEDNYQRLFWVMGIFVIIMGVLSLVFAKDALTLKPHKEGTFFQQFASVFRMKGFFKQHELLLACITATAFYIPFNIYFTHMGNWLIYHLGFGADSMGLIQGGALIVAMLLSIPAIKLINRNKTPFVAGAAIVANLIGLIIVCVFVRPESVNNASLFAGVNLPLFIAVFFCGVGIILSGQSLNMWVKQLFPDGARGQFEGVRILFFVLLPMLIGTTLGNIIVKTGSGTVINEYGITENIPTESIFLWAAIIIVFAFIPLFFAAKQYNKRVALGAGKE